jgi:hypothetical protein
VKIHLNGSRDSEHTAISNAAGCFEIEVPDTGFWFLEVGDDPWAVDTFTNDFVRGTIHGSCGAVLEVRPSAVVVGRVVGPGGDPIREGYVAAYDEVAYLFMGEPKIAGDQLARFLRERGVEHMTARTARGPIGSDGTFRLDGVVAEEPVHLFVHSNAVLPESYATLTLDPGETREVILEVPATSRFRGKVELPRLPANAEVLSRTAQFLNRGAPRPGADWERSTLEEDGTFTSVPLWHSELYEGRLVIEVLVGPQRHLRYWVHVFRTPLAEGQALDLDLGSVKWMIVMPGEVVDWRRDFQQ